MGSFELVDANDPDRGILAFLKSLGTSVVPTGEHEHGAHSHVHAYPDHPHGHFLRAICNSQACDGCPRHNIHEMPAGAPPSIR